MSTRQRFLSSNYDNWMVLKILLNCTPARRRAGFETRAEIV